MGSKPLFQYVIENTLLAGNIIFIVSFQNYSWPELITGMVWPR